MAPARWPTSWPAIHPLIEVIHRPGKQGLGTAYAAGFRKAISAGADLLLTMDADFSHDPQYLPAMLQASSRYDLVIGSRYVPGAASATGRGTARR